MRNEKDFTANEGDCRWYAIKTKCGYEMKLMLCIEGIRDSRFGGEIFDVAVATESGVLHTARANGKRKASVLWPGYVFVKMSYSYDVAIFIDKMLHVQGFVGFANPQPMTEKEISDAGLF